MNFHSKNESTKTQVSETFSGRKKKNTGSPIVWKRKRKKCSLWKLPSSISPAIYSVLTIIKPRDSAAGMAQIHLQRISACQRAEPLIVLQLRTSFISLLPLP